jgi:hypothetical protein
MREMPSDAQVMLRDCSLGIWVTLWYQVPLYARPAGRTELDRVAATAAACCKPFLPAPPVPFRALLGIAGSSPLCTLHSQSGSCSFNFPTATRLLGRSPLFALLSFFLHRTLARTYEAPVTVFSSSRSVTSSVAAARYSAVCRHAYPPLLYSSNYVVCFLQTSRFWDQLSVSNSVFEDSLLCGFALCFPLQPMLALHLSRPLLVCSAAFLGFRTAELCAIPCNFLT